MLRSRANDYQYLFLGGILGEILELPFVGNYLKVNKKILKGMGISHVHHYTPNSLKSAHANILQVRQLIAKLYAKNNRPVVIFAHSKACLEVVLCLMKNLPFFETCVARIICVQPPFQGHSVFDRFDVLKPLGKVWPGLKCLETDYYSDFFQEELVNDSELQNYMQKNLLVIKGSKPRSRDVAWIIRPSHLFLKSKGFDNDGLLKLKEQLIPFAQYREIQMEIDHSDIFTSTLLSNRDDEFRKNVMGQIIEWVLSGQGLPAIDQESFEVHFPKVPALDEAAIQ